tara:strand:+ start:227 stop:559 length:333 start_codon:yes stop_codon:yes gene_type:complete
MQNKEEKNWKEISDDISEVTKKVKDSLPEEDIVDDLKDSLFESIQSTSNLLKTLFEKVENTVKDDQIRSETKDIIDKINSEILDTVKDSGEKLKNFINDYSEINNLFEEE